MRICSRGARRRVAACVSVIVALAVCPNAFADDILVMSAGNTTPAWVNANVMGAAISTRDT